MAAARHRGNPSGIRFRALTDASETQKDPSPRRLGVLCAEVELGVHYSQTMLGSAGINDKISSFYTSDASPMAPGSRAPGIAMAFKLIESAQIR